MKTITVSFLNSANTELGVLQCLSHSVHVFPSAIFIVMVKSTFNIE